MSFVSEVHILGYGSFDASDVPVGGMPGIEVWGFNPPSQAHDDLVMERRVTRWYELHDLYIHRIRRPWYLTWLDEHAPRPLFLKGRRGYTRPLHDEPALNEIPGSVIFPRDECSEVTPHGHFHASSIDWLLAHAIIEGPDRIVMHGCMDLGGPKEPTSAEAALYYWAGVAEGRGIEVFVPKGSDLSPGMFDNVQLRGGGYKVEGQYAYDMNVHPLRWMERARARLREIWGGARG